MKKLLITNVVYGPIYAPIFCRQHLKSVLDQSNIPAFKDRIEYVIYTDADTRPYLEEHPNIAKLRETVPTSIVLFQWPKDRKVKKFDQRYGILAQTFADSVSLALERGSYLSAWVADLVVAKDFFTNIFAKLDSGYDSVFVLPLRSALEAIAPHLDAEPQAQTPRELFRLGYANLHPLWVASHWRATQFTKLPFSLLWNTGTGLIIRSYSITPIAFQPTEEMLKAKAIIDVEVPSMCKNPYWVTDFIECAVIGVEPLFCFYPTFANHTATISWVKDWSKSLHPKQKTYLEHKLYYPNKAIACADPINDYYAQKESDTVVRELMQ